MQTIVIDDKNPRIIYTSGWYNADGVHVTDYSQTVTVSGDSNAGFSFTFNGTSISIYGSVPSNNTAVSTYTLDTSTPTTFTNRNSTGPYKSGQLMYQLPTLSGGEHTLAVGAPDTVIGGAGTQFYFDYLTYVPSVGTDAASNPVESTGRSRSTRVAVVLPTVLVPCLVFIVALGAALYWYRRRQRAVLTVTPLRQEFGCLTENRTQSTLKLPSTLTSLPEVHDLRVPAPPQTVSDFAFPSSPVASTLAATPSMAIAVPPPSVLRARVPPSAFRPDPMLAQTRAARLQRFDGASMLGSARSMETADIPPTYRSTAL